MTAHERDDVVRGEGDHVRACACGTIRRAGLIIRVGVGDGFAQGAGAVVGNGVIGAVHYDAGGIRGLYPQRGSQQTGAKKCVG